jgi:hypothetical protein
MKSTRFLIAAVVVLIAATSSVNAQSEKRDHRNFTEIGFGVAGDLYVRIGSEYSVVLEGDSDLLSRVITEVKGKRLIFKTENFRWSGNQKLTAYVTLPSVEGLSLSGSGKINVESPLTGSALDLAISGSGRLIAGDLNYDKLNCSISGSGSFDLTGKGKINTAGISISGSGGYDAPALELVTLDARISGSGSCDCFVTERLVASISGSGDIYYSGNPRMDIRSSGSGKVRSK